MLGIRRKLRFTNSQFLPNQLSGIQFWVRSDSLSLAADAAVSQWNDESGNGRNLTQATGAQQPLYKVGIQNGKAVVRFDGSNDIMSSSAFTLNMPSTVFVAGKPPIANNTTMLDGLADSTRRFFRAFSGTDFQLYAGNYGPVIDPVSNAFHIFTAVFNIASSSLRMDGANDNTLALPDTNASGFALGSSPGGSAGACDIAEVIAYNRTLTTSERGLVERYLGSKYAITIP